MRRRGKRAAFTLILVAAAALLLAWPAFSYLPDYTTPGPQPDRWNFASFPVTWNLNPATGGNITGSRAVADIMQAAFTTWTAAPNAAIAVGRGADVTTRSESSSPPNVNLICFVCSDADFSADSSTLAVTITTEANAVGQPDGHGGTTSSVGQVIKADILFNPASTFTTGGTSGQDLLTVATHETGHFLGLGHSPVVRAVMFPAASSLVTLGYDDVAGISALYPKPTADVATGSISGTVTFSNGGGVFGAHVFAESITANEPFGGNIRRTPIGALTGPGGTYTIMGVPPDSYVVTAEPLDGPVMNSDLSGYASAFGQPAVQTNFTTRMH